MPQACALRLDEAIAQESDVCAREPIHAPGFIQPQGYLVGIDPHNGEPVTCSANLRQRLGDAALADWLPDALHRACAGLTDETRLECELPLFGPSLVHCFAGAPHVFCEFEPLAAALHGESVDLPLDRGLHRIAQAGGVELLAQTVAADIRALTGFERVMVYRFDAEGNGDVLGESLAPEWGQSMLGLSFPASDIPPQARALYVRSHARWTPSCRYEPVPLVPGVDAAGRPFDLGLSHYRDVSPVHRLYQQNLGTDGSMSLSVLQDGALWGLVIGHHRQVHAVPAARRHAAAVLVQAFALRLQALQAQGTLRAIQQEDRVHFGLLRKLALAEDFLAALSGSSPNILDLFPDCLGVAVVHVEGGAPRAHTIGATPPLQDLAQLAEWVRQRDETPVLATDQLSALYPAASRLEPCPAGLLAGVLDDPRRPVLMVFRPELVHSIDWAGRPEKVAGPDGVPNLPRRSFERWTEIQRGRSQPWSAWEMTVAIDIVSAINAVIARQSRRVAELTAAYEAAVARARTDGLLGISNRGWFDETLQRHIALAKRAHYPIGLLLIDIDDFKAYNDHYGHVAGDRCLVAVAHAVASLVNRLPDLAARFGGEELVCLLPDTDAAGVRRIGNSILEAVRALRIPHVRSRAGPLVTVSIGGVSMVPATDTRAEDMLLQVDQQLYRSKDAGRDQLTA